MSPQPYNALNVILKTHSMKVKAPTPWEKNQTQENKPKSPSRPSGKGAARGRADLDGQDAFWPLAGCTLAQGRMLGLLASWVGPVNR